MLFFKQKKDHFKLYSRTREVKENNIDKWKEVVFEITKKHREIIEKLNLDIEYVPKNPRVWIIKIFFIQFL